MRNVQAFLALTGYFRKFVENYSEISWRLTNLLRKDVVFRFGNDQKAVVKILKDNFLCKQQDGRTLVVVPRSMELNK